MRIKEIDIIFVCILLLFGEITSNIQKYEYLFPLYNYKSMNINNIKYTKITKNFYTSIYDNELNYITLKIPVKRNLLYHNNELTMYENVCKFVIYFVFHYIECEYLNYFYVNNKYLMFIVDSIYSEKIIERLQIINNKGNNLELTNNKKYDLIWMKYLGNKKQEILVNYMCLLSILKDNTHNVYIKNQMNIFKYMDYYFATNNYFNDNYIVKKYINNVLIINYKFSKILNNSYVINHYLNYKRLSSMVSKYYNLIMNVLQLFIYNLDRHKVKYFDIIKYNTKNMNTLPNYYSGIGNYEYNDILEDDVFI